MEPMQLAWKQLPLRIPLTNNSIYQTTRRNKKGRYLSRCFDLLQPIDGYSPYKQASLRASVGLLVGLPEQVGAYGGGASYR